MAQSKRKGNPRRANSSKRNALRKWLVRRGEPCWICGLPIDYSLPAGTPESFEADELVPVSRGGDPLSPDNLAAAHRCCNGWRKNKSVAAVVAIRESMRACGLSWSAPQQFVAYARAHGSGHPARLGAQSEKTNTTTSW